MDVDQTWHGTGKRWLSRSDWLLMVIRIRVWILDHRLIFFRHCGIGDFWTLILLAFLIQSTADLYHAWRNDWRRQDNASTTFRERSAYIRIRINSKIWIRIPDHIRLKFWRRRRFALFECTCYHCPPMVMVLSSLSYINLCFFRRRSLYSHLSVHCSSVFLSSKRLPQNAIFSKTKHFYRASVCWRAIKMLIAFLGRRLTRLVGLPEWVTVCGRVNHLCM